MLDTHQDEHTISKEGEISTRNDCNGDVELGASEAVELLAHIDIVRASQRVPKTKTNYKRQSNPNQALRSKAGATARAKVRCSAF